MPALEIRPRRATELVDASFQLLRHYYAQMVTVAAIAMAPTVLLRVIDRDQMSDPTQLMAHPITLAAIGFVSFLSFIGADAVLTVASSDAYLEDRVDTGHAFRVAVRDILSVFVANVVRFLGISVVIGIVAALAVPATLLHAIWLFVLIVPLAIWLYAYLFLRTFAVTNVILLENMGPMAALGRSWRLSKDCTAHIFFSVTLAAGLYFVISLIISTLGVTWLSPSTAGILSAVLFVLMYPMISVVWTLLYYDLRIRKEGFDLEVMSRELGTAPAPLPAA